MVTLNSNIYLANVFETNSNQVINNKIFKYYLIIDDSINFGNFAYVLEILIKYSMELNSLYIILMVRNPQSDKACLTVQSNNTIFRKYKLFIHQHLKMSMYCLVYFRLLQYNENMLRVFVVIPINH